MFIIVYLKSKTKIKNKKRKLEITSIYWEYDALASVASRWLYKY
jgi:hypothetical protein